MSDTVNKQLSSCLDGELPSEEATLLMKRLGRDALSRAALDRYSVMGEAMRDGLVPELLDGKFAQRVSEEIASEDVSQSGTSIWRGKIQRVMAGAGVAAAVAVVALVSLQTAFVESDQTRLSAQGEADVISYTVPQPPDRLTSYMVRHGSQAATARNSSWTRVVTDEAGDASVSTAEDAVVEDTDEGPEAHSDKPPKATP